MKLFKTKSQLLKTLLLAGTIATTVAIVTPLVVSCSSSGDSTISSTAPNLPKENQYRTSGIRKTWGYQNGQYETMSSVYENYFKNTTETDNYYLDIGSRCYVVENENRWTITGAGAWEYSIRYTSTTFDQTTDTITLKNVTVDYWSHGKFITNYNTNQDVEILSRDEFLYRYPDKASRENISWLVNEQYRIEIWKNDEFPD